MDPAGNLSIIASYETNGHVDQGSLLATTEWFGWFGGTTNLFQVDSSNQPTNFKTISGAGGSWVKILPDNSIVQYMAAGRIETLLYDGSGNWNLLNETAIPVPYPLLYSFYADNSILIFGYTGDVFPIYERTIDGGWSLSATINANTTSICTSIIPNGKDSIFFVYTTDPYLGGTKVGFILVFTKLDGEWIQTQVISADDLPVSLGITTPYSNGVINPDLIVLGNPADTPFGTTGKKRAFYPTGSVSFFQRQGDGITWELIAKSAVRQIGQFAQAVMVTSNHIVIPFLDTTADPPTLTSPESFYSIPLCLFDPINVTCHNVETSNSCGDIVDFMKGGGYTINSDQNQCGEISAMLLDNTYVNNTSTLTYTVTFGFDKDFASTTCNATLTCNTLTTPSNNEHPIPFPTPNGASDPAGNFSPTKKTSGANLSISSLIAHLIIVTMIIVFY